MDARKINDFSHKRTKNELWAKGKVVNLTHFSLKKFLYIFLFHLKCLAFLLQLTIKAYRTVHEDW